MDLREIVSSLLDMSDEDRKEITETVINETGNKLFIPNVGPQTEAIESEADELFYGGAAGGGKTALICGLAIQEHDKSLILRRTYPQLSGIFDEFERILGNREGLREQKKIWHLADGRRIDFGSVQHEKDKEDYQGRPHDFIAFDEITHFTEAIYRYIIGWNRHADPEQRCRVVVTGNPPMAAEGMWVIKYWGPWLDENHIRPAKDGELRWFTTVDGEDVECDGPNHMPEGATDKPRSRTFIGAKLEDNPEYMQSGYASVLSAMPEPMRTMLREGRFNVATIDDPYQVIPTEWIVEAQKRWIDNPMRHYEQEAIGVDVAQGGKDNTVLSVKRSTFANGIAVAHYFDELVAIPGKDTPDGKSVAAEVLKLRRDQAGIVVDAGGGYGGDTIARLTDQGIPVVGYLGAASADTFTSREGIYRFRNYRAYSLWSFREALDPDLGMHVALPPDPELLAQLAAPRFEVTPKGIQIESKEDIKERIGVSPDKADAVIYAFMADQKRLKRPKNLRNNLRSGNNNTRQLKARTGKQRAKIDGN